MERSASDKTAQIIIPPGSDVEIQSNSIEDHELHPIQFSIQLQAATTYIHYPTQANIFLGKKMRKKGSKSEKKKKPNKHADKNLNTKKEEVGDYDYDDPFIDDEEDYFMEQLLYKPKIEGYFAWKGAVPVEQVSEDKLKQLKYDDNIPDSEIFIGEVIDVESLSKRKKSSTSSTSNSNSNKKKKLHSDDITSIKKKSSTSSNSNKKKKLHSDEREPNTTGTSTSTTSTTNHKISTQKLGDLSPAASAIDANLPIADSNSGTPEKSKRTWNLRPLSDKFQQPLQSLKNDVATIEFKKGKFPLVAKQPLLDWVSAMIKLLECSAQEFAEESKYRIYWMHLKQILPFQSKTLKKITMKHHYPDKFLEKKSASSPVANTVTSSSSIEFKSASNNQQAATEAPFAASSSNMISLAEQESAPNAATPSSSLDQQH